MRRYRLSVPMCVGFLMLAGCTAQPTKTASLASAPALQPGMARVWVLRQPSAPGGNVAAADPMVYANGAAVARSAQGSVYFHDFQPEPTASRCKPSEPPPTSWTPSSSRRARRPMSRSRPCRTGKRALPPEVPALPC